jgi:hypothetical protein
MKKYLIKIIPLIVLALFTSSLEGAQKNTELAGKINGTPVPYNEFIQELLLNYYNFQYENDRAPDSREKELIRQETWKQKTMYVILKNYYKKYNIKVTAEETIEYLRNNPPEALKKSPLFMTDGKFNQKIYVQSLLYDTPYNLKPYRDRYQTYLIPNLKLQDYIIRDELLTSAEKKLIRKILQSSANIEWTIIDTDDINPYITEQEIQLYYQKHLSEFKLNPYINLAYTTISVVPSKTDIRLTNAMADSIYKELTQGKTVQDILNSDLTIVPYLSFINIDYVRESELEPSLYNILSQLKEGEFSPPIADNEGLNIYQLENRTKSMLSYNILRIPYIPSKSSIDVVLPAAQQVVKLARKENLSIACDEMNLDYHKTGNIAPDYDWFGDPQVVNNILNLIPKYSERYVFEPIYSPMKKVWVIVELLESSLNVHQSLEEVRPQIQKKLEEQKRTELALQLADKISSGQHTIPSDAPTIYIENMTITTPLLGNDATNIYYQTLHRYFKKEKPKAYILEGKILLPKVISVKIDKKKKISEDQLIQLYKDNLPPNWFDTWMDSKVKKAKVKIYI